jgi:hypothetical protein
MLPRRHLHLPTTLTPNSSYNEEFKSGHNTGNLLDRYKDDKDFAAAKNGTKDERAAQAVFVSRDVIAQAGGHSRRKGA